MITGIILASGFSRRMRQDKLLLPVDGMPAAECVIRAADASLLDEIVLVYREAAVRELARAFRCRAVYNPDAAEGQSAAVRAGITAARPDAEAYLFMVGDQPRMTASVINRLIAAWQEKRDAIVVPVYTAKRGNPVLFSAALKDELLALQGDEGGRSILERKMDMVYFVDVEDPSAGADIDTPEDYEVLKREK